MSDIPYVDIVKARKRNWEAYAHTAIGALEEALSVRDRRLETLAAELLVVSGELIRLGIGLDDIRKSTRPPAGTTIADTDGARASRLDYIRYRAEDLLAKSPRSNALGEVLEAATKWFRRKRNDARVGGFFHTVEEEELYYKLQALDPSESYRSSKMDNEFGPGVTRS